MMICREKQWVSVIDWLNTKNIGTFDYDNWTPPIGIQSVKNGWVLVYIRTDKSMPELLQFSIPECVKLLSNESSNVLDDFKFYEDAMFEKVDLRLKTLTKSNNLKLSFKHPDHIELNDIVKMITK
jgi:hypothetical protein